MRITSIAAALALTAGLGLAGGSAGTAAVAAPAAAVQQATAYAMTAVGYGTYVRGGDVPANSGQTAFQVLACTNRAGIDRSNTEASQDVPGLGNVSGAATRVWSQQIGDSVSSYGRHTIESVTVSSPTGSLLIEGIRSTSRAWHDAAGFHSSTATTVAALTYTPAGGEAQQLATPTVNQPVTVPGIGEVRVGERASTSNPGGAKASAAALQLDLLTTGTHAVIARSAATIAGGVRGGLFSGYSSGSRARGLQDTTRSGATPLLLMPCQGTRSTTQSRSLASSQLGTDLVVEGLTATQWANQDSTRSTGYERGYVDVFRINGTDLVVNSVLGRVNVLRTDAALNRSHTAQVGQVRANGEDQEFPDNNILEIPGVARLQRGIVTRTTNGISVVALRVTLLDGSGAVIDLGQASLSIRDSGL